MVDQALLPRLLGIDWGSTSLRVFLLDDRGRVLLQRGSVHGVSTINGKADAYAKTLLDIAGDWLLAWPELPVVACGMAGSRHGWREVDYVPCPATVDEVASGAASVALPDGRLVWIVPGLRLTEAGATPDTMRGEETQLAGVLADRESPLAEGCVVMPGTHSKWTRLSGGKVQAFSTYMTGELFDVLSNYSVLGRLMPAKKAETDWYAFIAGVDAARCKSEQTLSHQLFSVRTLGLTGAMSGTALKDYLSGLLIGHELQGGLAWREAVFPDDTPLALVGDTALCVRYARALHHVGQEAVMLSNTAPVGLWQIALAIERLGTVTCSAELQA